MKEGDSDNSLDPALTIPWAALFEALVAIQVTSTVDTNRRKTEAATIALIQRFESFSPL